MEDEVGVVEEEGIEVVEGEGEGVGEGETGHAK